MQTVKEFDSSGQMTLGEFWWATGPTLVGILLLTLVIVLWRRDSAIDLRARAWKKWRLSWCGVFIADLLAWVRRIRRPRSSKGQSLPQHSTTSGRVAGQPQPTPQISGSGLGGNIQMLMVPSSGSQPQLSPSGAYPTSLTSTNNPNGASGPASSAGQLSTWSPLPASVQSGTHAP